MVTQKIRLDKLLVDRGIAPTLEKARALILARAVKINEVYLDKAGAPVGVDSEIHIKGEDNPYVSRGGLKLKEALKEFNLNVEGIVALDVGASTGGFTDCLLQAGARKVYALDVGYGQLVWKLREDKRVVVIERTNIRYYEGVDFDEQINLATIDVSFIPLKIVLPAVLRSPLSLHEFSLFAFVSSEPDPTPKIVASLPRQSRAPRLSFGTPLIATSC